MTKTFFIHPKKGQSIETPDLPDTDFSTLMVTLPEPAIQARVEENALYRFHKWMLNIRGRVDHVDEGELGRRVSGRDL